VQPRRGLLWLVLIYVTLDLASPWIPGAFVFDAAQSIESVTFGRDRLALDGIVQPPMPRDRLVVSEPQNDVGNDTPPPASRTHHRHSVVSCLPRARCAVLRPSEDPY
jgi:hypothetical protein